MYLYVYVYRGSRAIRFCDFRNKCIVNAINHGLPPSRARYNLNFRRGQGRLKTNETGPPSYQSGKRLADTDEAICACSAAARANIYARAMVHSHLCVHAPRIR